jgi:predicted nucleic acid-binding protein
MNLVDSSGWLEYFSGSENAAFFAPAIEDTDHLLVPTIILYEVFKRLIQQVGTSAAQTNVGDMLAGQVIDLNDSLAMSAAQIAVDLKIPMADSIILATAREYDSMLWTQDEHFKGMEDVKFFGKKS